MESIYSLYLCIYNNSQGAPVTMSSDWDIADFTLMRHLLDVPRLLHYCSSEYHTSRYCGQLWAGMQDYDHMHESRKKLVICIT